MSHYEFLRLVCLEKIDPKIFGGRNNVVSAVQRLVIRKKNGSTPTTNVSERTEIENKREDMKRKLEI